MNSRETLAHVAEWLGWQEETLSYGLRNAFDALRLYDYAQAHPDLPEMADDWEEEVFIAAIGYSPMSGQSHEAKTTGADLAVKAMRTAGYLLDSVAFVSEEGDTEQPLAALDVALGRAEVQSVDRALFEAASPARANGQYIGKIVAIDDEQVIQDSGRGKLVSHERAKFEKLPKVGDKLDIKYADKVMAAAKELSQDGHAVSVAVNTR